jgi:hypothetical protein
MKNYPVQIISTIQNKNVSIRDTFIIIANFIKSIDYKMKGEGVHSEGKPYLIKYTFSYKNAIKFINLLQDLGYSFEIKLYVKTIKGVAIYE